MQESENIVSIFNEPHFMNSHILGRFRYFASLPRYQNAWILDKCWVEIIKKEHNIPDDIHLDSIQLNKAIGYDKIFRNQSIDQLTIPNNLGIYRNEYHTKEEYINEQGTKRIKTIHMKAYYSSSDLNLPKQPLKPPLMTTKV